MKYFIIIILSITVFSCGDKNSLMVYIISDNSAGLEVNSEVLCKGVNIGNVSDVELFGNKVLITLSLSKKTKVPTNAKILVGVKNMVKKTIQIDYEVSNDKFINSGDSLRLNLGYKSIIINDGYSQVSLPHESFGW